MSKTVLMTNLFNLLWVLAQIASSLGDLGPVDNQVRLVAGNRPGEGRVEIYYNGRWGTVCDDSWDNDDAQVVCRQLGYDATNAQAHSNAYFGAGLASSPIWLDNVDCSGMENALSKCSASEIGTHNCNHNEDAAVSCSAVGEFSEVRLVGGKESWQGRVEVKKFRIWGTICDDHWDDSDAAVVCQQLRFRFKEAKAESAADYGFGTGPIYLDDVQCEGNEPSVWHCNANDTSGQDCVHSEDAAVDCGNQEEPCDNCESDSDLTIVYVVIGIMAPVLIVVVVIIVCKCCCNNKEPRKVHMVPMWSVQRPVIIAMKVPPNRRPFPA